MVTSRDKDRGIRLGEADSIGYSVVCLSCRQSARIRLDVALRLWGERTRLGDIARDMRCGKCDAGDVMLHCITDTRLPETIAEDPAGRWEIGPAWPEIDPPPAPATVRASIWSWETDPVCNLYDIGRDTRDAWRGLLKVERQFDLLGNLPLEYEGKIYPDKDAPVVRVRKDGERELVMMRWGFPPPQPRGRPVTNTRNLESPFWQAWLGKPQYRCLVSADAFAEPHPTRKDDRGWKENVWFAMKDKQPFAFAGVWRPWTGERSIGNRQTEIREWNLFAFLTCEPNELVRPIHEKAMPVILRAEDYGTWLSAEWSSAKVLARPLEAERMILLD